eukprot:CAMPEP_0172330482 /NCGR_PEP_ID=MMETSP1058-20130122/61426_1 /TAXON_ID=83371 /ORGANISM="Detonula confervacea, Strain CCMP 353" /LENGTH=382 /DNA_ID=CAMNT_0013047697 /DNA_START=81 /DNA_END=1227 /DNA_ORIENTATION=+
MTPTMLSDNSLELFRLVRNPRNNRGSATKPAAQDVLLGQLFGSANERRIVRGHPYFSMDDDDGDDIEDLAAKACALASIPIPNYSDAFDRKNKKYKTKKYRDKVQQRRWRDKDPHSIELANKTSNILASFADYISAIEVESPGTDILNNSYSPDGKKGGDVTRGVLSREWTYDEFHGECHGSARRREPLDRNLHVSKRDEDDDHDDDDRSFSSNTKERIRYWYSHPVHSKNFKIGLIWIIVLCVLIGVVIVISPGGEKANTENALLEKVGGVEQLNKEHTDTTQQDLEFEEFQGQNENRDKELNYVDELLIESIDVKEQYPRWFARATGWSGSSYPESIDFCASQEMTLCPYEAYCPDDDHALYEDGMVVSNGGSKEQWSPT